MQDFSSNLVEHVAATGGDVAEAALDFGLIDGLLSRNGIRDYMIELVGKSEWQKDSFNSIGMYDYLTQMNLFSQDSNFSKNVAVVVAAGDIMFGEQSPGSVGADSTAALLRRARESDLVQAVVLRVDSPGGSAFAAEVIADEVKALQAAGKPVVASMSSVAASGGLFYFYARGSDFGRPGDDHRINRSVRHVPDVSEKPGGDRYSDRRGWDDPVEWSVAARSENERANPTTVATVCRGYIRRLYNRRRAE